MYCMVYERCIVNRGKNHLKIHLDKSGGHHKTSSFKQSKFHLKYFYGKCIVKDICAYRSKWDTLYRREYIYKTVSYFVPYSSIHMYIVYIYSRYTYIHVYIYGNGTIFSVNLARIQLQITKETFEGIRIYSAVIAVVTSLYKHTIRKQINSNIRCYIWFNK